MKITPSPVFLLAGSPGQRRSGPDPLLKQVFHATGKASPSIAYVGVASEDNTDFFKCLASLFKKSGAGGVRLAAMASPRDDIQAAEKVIREADLVFITGGDVEAGMTLLRKRKILPLLHRLYQSGKPFFGLSAGSIMLARAWIRWKDPDDDATAESFACLKFAPILCDMHDEASDWSELKSLLKITRCSAVGYGLPAGSGLCIGPGRSVTAIGKPVVRFQSGPKGIKPLPSLPPTLLVPD
jgi:peptidase E